jgi:hypothetical protein
MFSTLNARRRIFGRARKRPLTKETAMAKGKGKAKRTEAAAGASAQAADQAKVSEGTKAPPAQEGDAKEEVKVAKAEPVLLPTVDQAKADLDANPARTSVLSKDGHVVRGE